MNLKEVCDKYRHMDKILSDYELLVDGSREGQKLSMQILYDLWQVVKEAQNCTVAEIEDLKRRLISHQKGESVRGRCPRCKKWFWCVDDENIICPFCEWTGIPE